MKNQGNISFVGIMMIASQLLLTLFLGYWIYTQFNEKRVFLSEEIERGLRVAEEQVIDSMLASDIINPLINDTNYMSVYISDSTKNGNSFSMEMEMDSISQLMMQFSGDQESKIQNNHQIITRIASLDSGGTFTNPNMQSTITVNAEQDSGNQIIFQGVKMLINTIGKFDVDQSNIYSFFSPVLDTTLLTRSFQSFISNNYNSFLVNWKSIKESEINQTHNSEIVLSSFLFEDPYGVQISGFMGYLIKSIGSQIAFAIFLLLITTIAFRMAFVNLKNQRKLITIKNDFISNITHELKTPVSTVKVALEALLDFNLRNDQKRTKEYLEIAHSEMDRLNLLVNQVLNNSALEESGNFLNPEKIELVSLVKEVLQGMQSRFNSEKAIVIFDDKNIETYVYADKLHLHGVIVNLLDNSLKYTTDIPEIAISISQTNSETKLIVCDNGIGIPSEYTDKIFDKFFRVPKGNEHSVKGYGLGLNYASLVINQLGGKINVQNNIDEGCCFTIILPVNR